MSLGTKKGNAGKAVLLLGHGSKAPEANETLRRVAGRVGEAGGFGLVFPAFLQMERPDFQEAVSIMAEKGFMDIVVMPYFLYMGLHVTKDLPEEIETAEKRFPGLKITVTKNLGYDERLVDLTVQRIEESAGKAESNTEAYSQHPIERESFRLIGEELDEAGVNPAELPIVKRVIHTTADFEYKDLVRFSPNAIQAGLNAIKKGANIVVDVNMIKSGVTGGRLKPFGTKVLCFSSDKDVARIAEEEKTTKTAASMIKAAPFMDGAIVAIGNAPTALFEVLKLVREKKAAPALIIGVPVGFVGARESKDELMKSGAEYIAVSGRKGGSTVAVAIVNALLIEAGKEAFALTGC